MIFNFWMKRRRLRKKRKRKRKRNKRVKRRSKRVNRRKLRNKKTARNPASLKLHKFSNNFNSCDKIESTTIILYIFY